jgi:hypothetical protein
MKRKITPKQNNKKFLKIKGQSRNSALRPRIKNTIENNPNQKYKKKHKNPVKNGVIDLITTYNYFSL